MTNKRKKTKNQAYGELTRNAKDLLDALQHLEIWITISDADTLMIVAKVLEDPSNTSCFPEVADELAKAMRSLANKPYAIKQAQERRDAGVLSQC